jgi:hypothetical protein
MPHDLDAKATLRPNRDRRHIPERRAQWRGGQRADDFSPSVRQLAARIIGEYLRTPGLKLTLEQAALRFPADVNTCTGVLLMLARRGIVTRIPNGHFVMLPRPSRPLSLSSLGRKQAVR